jgi:hypothetical protein
MIAVMLAGLMIPHPLVYVCPRVISTPKLDGRLDAAEWGHAPWTADFQDIEGDKKPKPRHRTRAKMMWDDENLYIGAEMEEPHVWATLTEHDSVIFYDNDFEVFLDPDDDGHQYVEMELNALNTTWDLLLPRPYRGGGPALNAWEIKGMRTAVHVDGTLNDASDMDRGWSVEIACPWSALREVSRTALPPKDGEQWRINFSRVQWKTTIEGGKYVKVPNTPEDNWVWSAQHTVDMHWPTRWGVLQFANATQNLPAAKTLDAWSTRMELESLWSRQSAYRQEHGRFGMVAELGLTVPGLTIEASTNQFEATLGDYRVNQELRLWKFR